MMFFAVLCPTPRQGPVPAPLFAGIYIPAWIGFVAGPKSSANRKTGTKFRFLGFDYAGIALIPSGVNSLTHVHGVFEPYVIW